MPLELTEYTGSFTRFAGLRIFSSWDRACAHLCDHVLTMPEAKIWGMIAPELTELVYSKRRFAVGKSFWEGTEGESASELYGVFCDVSFDALDSLEITGWVWNDPGKRAEDVFCLGLNGLLLILSPQAKTVRTAYFPGHGNAQQVESSKEIGVDPQLRKKDPFPRETGAHPGGLYRKRESVPNVPVKKIDDKRKLFYKIYRKSAVFVRRSFVDSLKYIPGQDSEANYSLVLPFEAWCEVQAKEG